MDEIIEKEVSGRFRILGVSSRRLKVQVVGSTVFLHGEVDSAWKAKAAARECASVPDVNNVISRISVLQ